MKTIAVFFVLLLAATGASTQASGAPTLARFGVTLTAEGRTPTAGKPWHFVVRATDAAGRPVGGTAIVQVFSGGRLFDTVGWFGFKGQLRRAYRWPAVLRGSGALLQATVVGPGGTRTVGYAVRVVAETGHPRFRAALVGDNHTPSARASWRFVVHAVDAAGNPVGGTAIVRVVAAGRTVDTVGWFGFDGSLRRTYRWSPKLRGSSAQLQATVVGPGGTRTVAYRVRVR